MNSFGYGGTNAHVVLEQAPPRQQESLVDSMESAAASPAIDVIEEPSQNAKSNGHALTNGDSSEPLLTNGCSRTFNENEINLIESHDDAMDTLLKVRQNVERPQLLVLTAQSEVSLADLIKNTACWVSNTEQRDHCLRDVALTLSSRRSIMPWRCSAVATTYQELVLRLTQQAPRATKASNRVQICFIFTGQGSQWPAMGRELMYSISRFRKSLVESDRILRALGAEWSLVEEVLRDKSTSRIYEGEVAQPATTAIQIALVGLLESLGIWPTAVLGHSSGEVAAAFTAGALSHTEALKVAYYRGLILHHASAISNKGAMLAVALGEGEVSSHLPKIQSGKISIACVNSPISVTVSGDEAAIDDLQHLLDNIPVFSRRLRVDAAYHSHHMRNVADEYYCALEGLSWKNPRPGVKYISSVTASEKISHFGPKYWVENLESPVRFSEGLEKLCAVQQGAIGDAASETLHALIEVGPHSALSGPIHQTIAQSKLDSFNFIYSSTLIRGKDAVEAILGLSGLMFEHGHEARLDIANSLFASKQSYDVVHDLPPYPWNHLATYWHESRISKDHRFRAHPHHELLGLRVLSGNTNEPVWRNTIGIDGLPWLRDHIVDDLMLLPGAAYLCMVIEAIRQIRIDRGSTFSIHQFVMKDIVFQKALIIPDSPHKIEIQLTLKPPTSSGESHSDWQNFQVSSLAQDGIWHRHSYGSVRVDPECSTNEIENGREEAFTAAELLDTLHRIKQNCSEAIDRRRLYDELRNNGNVYGSSFNIIKELHVNDTQAVGTIRTPNTMAIAPSVSVRPYIIHPAVLDSLLQVNIPLFHRNCGQGSVIPISINEVVVSTKVISDPESELVLTAELTKTGPRSAMTKVAAFQSGSVMEWQPMVTVIGCELRGIGEAHRLRSDAEASHSMRYQVEWSSDVDFLTAKTIRSSTPNIQNEHSGMLPEQRDYMFNRLAAYYISKLLHQLTSKGLQASKDYYSHLLRWMKWYTSSGEGRDLINGLDEVEVDGIARSVKGAGAQGEMLVRMGERLTSIIAGGMDPLSLMLEDSLLYRVYQDDSSLQCCAYLITFVKQLIFKQPFISVIELGAGTAGTTIPLLQALDRDGCLKIQQYDFTDISSGFFEPAQGLLGNWSGFIRFKKLDIEQDPMAQGFEKGSYDLVIASNVLHATSCMDRTLSHVRKLLKPNGRLALIEATKLPPFFNAMFGLLPGWWKGIPVYPPFIVLHLPFE